MCLYIQVLDSKTFTKTEDHEVMIEKKEYELEHRPVEKQVSALRPQPLSNLTKV